MTDYILEILILVFFFLLYLSWIFSQNSNGQDKEKNYNQVPIESDFPKEVKSEHLVKDVKVQSRKNDKRFENCSKIPSIKYKCLTCNQPCHLSDIKRPSKK